MANVRRRYRCRGIIGAGEVIRKCWYSDTEEASKGSTHKDLRILQDADLQK